MLAPLQPLAQFQERYLAPILAHPDDSAFRLLQPFAGTLAAARIIDLPRIDNDALQLLQDVAQRTLAHADLRDGGRRGSFPDWDGPAVIRSLLFVELDGAGGATRFANGDWTDLPRVLPLIDAVVRGAGSHPYVMQQFLTLCERASTHYPAEVYADQMLHLMTRGALPAAWMGTALPARIASIVQEHADAAILSSELRQQLLRLLDALVDLGDRRSAALQQSDAFRRVRILSRSAEG